MTEPKKRNSTSLMLLLLYALLIASLLVLTLAGARLYSDTMDARDAHAKQRAFVYSKPNGSVRRQREHPPDRRPGGPGGVPARAGKRLRNAHLFI